MTQDFSDLGQRCPAAKHPGGKAMAQKVSTLDGWIETRSLYGATDDCANCRGTGEAAKRRSRTYEDAAGVGGLGTVLAQVGYQRLSHIRKERQAILNQSFPSDRNLAPPPIDVLEL